MIRLLVSSFRATCAYDARLCLSLIAACRRLSHTGFIGSNAVNRTKKVRPTEPRSNYQRSTQRVRGLLRKRQARRPLSSSCVADTVDALDLWRVRLKSGHTIEVAATARQRLRGASSSRRWSGARGARDHDRGLFRRSPWPPGMAAHHSTETCQPPRRRIASGPTPVSCRIEARAGLLRTGARQLTPQARARLCRRRALTTAEVVRVNRASRSATGSRRRTRPPITSSSQCMCRRRSRAALTGCVH